MDFWKNYGLLGMAMLMWGCSSDNAATEQAVVNIHANVATDDCLLSRALNAQNDEKATRCLMEIWRDGVKQGVEALSGHEDTGFSLSLALYQGMEYQFYFWADPGEDFYVAEDLSNIALASGAVPEVAYWGSYTLTPTDKDQDLDITLTHAVAKVSYVTSTALQAQSNTSLGGHNSVTMTLERVYPGFNATSGEAIGTPSSRICLKELTSDVEANTTVMSAYAFVDEYNQEVNLQYAVAPAVSVASVPMGTNVHTKLVGDISGQASLKVTAEISKSWNSTQVSYATESGLKAVDLGGSVYWASMNLGATSEEDYGDYYQWGVLEPSIMANAANYFGDEDCEITSENDAATYLLGEPWRMPTRAEYEELQAQVTAGTIERNQETDGVRFTNLASGANVYFPFAGHYYSVGVINGYNYYRNSNHANSDNSKGSVYDVKNNNFVSVYGYQCCPIRAVKSKDQ